MYLNTRKLASTFGGPYKIITKLFDVNYEIGRPNYYTVFNTVIVLMSKLRHYYSPDKFNLSYEEKQTKVKSKLSE